MNDMKQNGRFFRHSFRVKLWIKRIFMRFHMQNDDSEFERIPLKGNQAMKKSKQLKTLLYFLIYYRFEQLNSSKKHPY